VAEGNTDDVAFDCVVGGSLDACTDRVSKGTADLVVLGGGCWEELACGGRGCSSAWRLVCVKVGCGGRVRAGLGSVGQRGRAVAGPEISRC
jgi:hypothetical protein